MGHYKMVGVNIKDAKASRTPKVIAKYVTMKNTVKLTKDTACKMYKGKGYKNKVYDYYVRSEDRCTVNISVLLRIWLDTRAVPVVLACTSWPSMTASTTKWLA